ncbi:MAG: ABC transporter permease, partial [Candidatus Binatia bacterium]
PEAVQRLSLVTFNAWALDGFLDVLWRDQPLAAIVPEIAVLLGWSALFFVVARRLARRWELV